MFLEALLNVFANWVLLLEVLYVRGDVRKPSTGVISQPNE